MLGTLNFFKKGAVQPWFLVRTAAQDATYDGPGTKFNLGAVTTFQFLLLLGILITVRFPGNLRIYLSLVHNMTHPGYIPTPHGQTLKSDTSERVTGKTHRFSRCFTSSIIFPS